MMRLGLCELRELQVKGLRGLKKELQVKELRGICLNDALRVDIKPRNLQNRGVLTENAMMRTGSGCVPAHNRSRFLI